MTTSGSSWSSRWWLTRSARSSWLASADSQDRSDWASEASSSTLGGAVLEEALELLDEGGLDDVGVGARRDVEDDEAERGAVDEAPRRGVGAERGLLAADQPAHEARRGEAADAVERHRGSDEVVGLVDREAEGDVQAVVGHDLVPLDAGRALERVELRVVGPARRGARRQVAEVALHEGEPVLRR